MKDDGCPTAVKTGIKMDVTVNDDSDSIIELGVEIF